MEGARPNAAAWLLLLGVGIWLLPASPVAGARLSACPPFYLRTDDGSVINPLTQQNANEPYSPRQTCGACHDYDQITKGYHFQQGWDVIRDDYDPEHPWVLSPGMHGKM